MVFGNEKIVATLLDRIDSVFTSTISAEKNQSNPTPKKPPINEGHPFVEIIKLIKKLAMTTDHQGKIL